MNIFLIKDHNYTHAFLSFYTYLMNTDITRLLSVWQSFLWYILMNDYRILLILKVRIQRNEIKYDLWL